MISGARVEQKAAQGSINASAFRIIKDINSNPAEPVSKRCLEGGAPAPPRGPR